MKTFTSTFPMTITRRLAVAFLGLLSALGAMAQTAPDFTADDCDGVSHNLYSELNSGKVIVLCWVMPCGPCIGPSVTAYNAVQGFSNPNVLFYLIDDEANTSCSSLSSWATNYGIGNNRKTFSTKQITESLYGGVGMPHIAVLGWGGKYFFNKLNGAANDATGIQNAISTALASLKTETLPVTPFSFKVYPSPSSEDASVEMSLPSASGVTLDVLTCEGQLLEHRAMEMLPAGTHTYRFDCTSWADGVYFVRLTANRDSRMMRLVVSHGQ